MERMFELTRADLFGYYKDGTIMEFFEGSGMRQELSPKGLNFLTLSEDERQKVLLESLDNMKFFTALAMYREKS